MYAELLGVVQKLKKRWIIEDVVSKIFLYIYAFWRQYLSKI